MAKNDVVLKKTDSILDELVRLHHEISQRAYDFFRNQEGLSAGPLADWLEAERELVWRPAIDLRQKDGEFTLEAAIAGVAPNDLDVQVTPEDVLIKASVQHQHDASTTVHICEFKTGQLFRSIHLPDRIDPDSVKAEYRHGLLRLTGKIAPATPKTVEVQAA